jgi:hypothetical protein
MAVTWTATVEERWRESSKRYSRVKLTTSASGNTYTTGGDAPPAFGALGLKRNLEALIFTDGVSGDGFIYKYDQTNNKIKVFVENDAAAYAQRPQMAELPAATALNSKTAFVIAIGV